MSSRVILALTGQSHMRNLRLVEALGPQLYAVKIHDSLDGEGPGVIRDLHKAGAPLVWVDAKLHDTPETVRQRVIKLVGHGANIVSVHASGGSTMLRAAKKAAGPSVQIYAVTVLTSLTEYTARLVYGKPIAHQVLLLASFARRAKVDGIVCSPLEVALLSRDPTLKKLSLIVPGVRSIGAPKHDQVRIETPSRTIKNGAKRVVVGREVTDAPDPPTALQRIITDIAAVTTE